MSHPTPPPPVPIHEPSLETVELLCERLGELGLPVGVDTAREILRAVLAIESPRMDAASAKRSRSRSRQSAWRLSPRSAS